MDLHLAEGCVAHEDLAEASTGRIDEGSGTVTLPARTRTVTVDLRPAP